MDKYHDVFLSYSWNDKEWAIMLEDTLASADITVWRDEKKMGLGDIVPAKIDEGLRNCSLLIQILSSDSAISKWCEIERGVALNMEIMENRTVLIPAFLESRADLNKTPTLLIKKGIYLFQDDWNDQLLRRILPLLQIPRHCWDLRRRPIIDGRFYHGEYHIEPNDLLRVQLEEIEFKGQLQIQAKRKLGRGLTIDRLLNEISKPMEEIHSSAIVLLGEAGIGKTTLCNWLSRLLSEKSLVPPVVPVYAPLSGYHESHTLSTFLNGYTFNNSFNELLQTCGDQNRKMVLFLDGLNELRPVLVKKVLEGSRRLMRNYGLTIIITTRPVAALDDILIGEKLRFFEIQRWTTRQLREYLNRMGYAELFDTIPKEVRTLLKLPIFAFLAISLTDDLKLLSSLKTIRELFELILNRFLSPISLEKKGKSLDVNTIYGDQYRPILELLAYSMTTRNVVQISGEELENLLSHSESIFKDFLGNMVNSGIIRCSYISVAINPNTDINELRQLKISFLHQSLQEYLTAAYFCSHDELELPQDVSHDAFWREVPVYIIQSLDSRKKQKAFVLKFLLNITPDYLTAARVANEIEDVATLKNMHKLIIGKLISNIALHQLYEYVIEAFGVLGEKGLNALRGCLHDNLKVRSIFAKAEAHLIGELVGRGDEIAWRPLGRSIYILGELGDLKFIESMENYLGDIKSIHLLYHIGEALLTISSLDNGQNTRKGRIATIACKMPKRDPIIEAYCIAALRRCDESFKNSVDLEDRLYRLLLDKATKSNPNYAYEFWQRAHGVEAFTEVAGLNKCVEILSVIFNFENSTDYTGYEVEGFGMVHSSIIKAILRFCDRVNYKDESWNSLLEMVLVSKRAAYNSWLCRHLERLLLRWFSTPKDLDWIQKWEFSLRQKGSPFAKVLSNVLWINS